MIAPKLISNSDEEALTWAKQHFLFSQYKLLIEHPWTRILELKGNSEKCYLKLVRFNPAQVIKNHSIISRHFRSTVPETIADNIEIGAQLFHHHDGIALGYSASEILKSKLLTTYAKLQAEATEIPEIHSSIPVFKHCDVVNNFLEFLRPGAEETSTPQTVKADFFLGHEESIEYYDVFLARRDLLDNLLNQVALLPATLNHCDLSTAKVFETDEGSHLIDDWDKALIGPAGLSLATFFGGSFKITQFLNEDFGQPQDASLIQEQRLLNDYIVELDKQGYASLEILQKALPASACAGAMQTILNFAHFPIQDDPYIFDVNDTFVRRLDDLLNLCDFLSCVKRSRVVHFAADYEDKNILFRAATLYRQYLRIHCNDFELYKKLASTLLRCGKLSEAIDCFQTIIEQNQGDASVFNELGIALLETNQPVDAIVNFEQALAIDPGYQQSQINLDKATELLSMRDEAYHPNKLPTIRVSQEERHRGVFSFEKTNLACSLFQQYGALILEKAFDVELLQAINRLIFDKYSAYFEPEEFDSRFEYSDGYRKIVPNIEGPINSPNLYDNPFLNAITRQILGDDFILGALCIETHLPGTEYQPIHQNHPPLFDGDNESTGNTSFAIAVMIPLAQNRSSRGNTRVIKESHKTSYLEAPKLPVQTPFLEMGSALMVDYRVALQTFCCNDDSVPPMLTLVFQRAWFRDRINFSNQPSIQFDNALFYTAPERLKELIYWIKSESDNPIELELVIP